MPIKRVYSAEQREQKNVEEKHSKEKLTKDTIKKIKTTMIGAIASIEEHFEMYFEDENFREIFEELREEILDKGNKQIRALELELKQYSVKWNRHEYQLPVREMYQ